MNYYFMYILYLCIYQFAKRVFYVFYVLITNVLLKFTLIVSVSIRESGRLFITGCVNTNYAIGDLTVSSNCACPAGKNVGKNMHLAGICIGSIPGIALAPKFVGSQKNISGPFQNFRNKI